MCNSLSQTLSRIFLKTRFKGKDVPNHLQTKLVQEGE